MLKPETRTAAPSARETKKEQNRQAIAQAALSLFEAKGFEGTTMDEIAQAAGVSRPTVFNYFARKEDILLVLGDTLRERMAAQLKAIHLQGGFNEPLAALRRVLITMASAFGEYPKTARAFHLHKMQVRPEVLLEPGCDPIQEQRGLVRLLVESAQARGELRSDYSADEITAHLMIGLFAGAVGPWLLGKTPSMALTTVIDRHFDLYVQGLGA
ncbi:MAG TPA: TetR/AcrR family transcriptional regulator [Stenomitos sp.]